jgi:NADP-dependent 3-hydroxy acid dehydrogenase YdfG
LETVTISSPNHREPELLGQIVVVIGGSAGIGFETARRARAGGAKVILTGRDTERLQRAASEVDAVSTAPLVRRPSMQRILLLSTGSSMTSRQSTK